MGLVQLFRDMPCPDVMARELLNRVLADFRETGHHYLLELVHAREKARQGCTAEKLEEVKALDAQIHEHVIHEQIPQRWQLDFLFSHAGYDTLGDGILPVWATILIEICVLEQYWESLLLGLRPKSPYFLAGFHSEKDVFSTDWLEDFRPSWKKEAWLRGIRSNRTALLAPSTRPSAPPMASDYWRRPDHPGRIGAIKPRRPLMITDI